jgi:hypothetical protein
MQNAYRALEHWDADRETPRRWNALRKFYGGVADRLESGERFDPYFIDWHREFSPIESLAWVQIRQLGLRFFPQYPIGKFFVDFADPCKRIVIECDGKAFHDPAKDAERDAVLRSMGWQVVRMTGRALNLPDEHPESAWHKFCYLAGRDSGEEDEE